MARKHYSFEIPCRLIFFKYRDVPGELHAVCLESGSFGLGANFDETVHGVAQSVMEQVALGVQSSTFIHATDPEWEQAWTENRITAVDGAEIVAKATAKLTVETHKGNPKVVFNERVCILNPAVRETQVP